MNEKRTSRVNSNVDHQNLVVGVKEIFLDGPRDIDENDGNLLECTYRIALEMKDL